jgi:enolase-phosphatase E1
LLAHVTHLIATDSKASNFKALQGHLWRTGFENGTLVSPLFPDVLSTLRAWKAEGKRLAIFSSGSVPAQKLFLGHVAVEGKEVKSEDVNDLFSGNFDTVNAGAKNVRESYDKIAAELRVNSKEVLFLSDNVNEVRAAIEAGMASFVVDRPGNAELTEEDRKDLVVITSLRQVEFP